MAVVLEEAQPLLSSPLLPPSYGSSTAQDPPHAEETWGGGHIRGQSSLHHGRSAGVARAEAISARLSPAERFWIFWGIFLIGYAYGLESQVRSTYLPYATAGFSMHSYLATINVLRNVIAVALQPTAAKLADIFGRFEVVAASTVFYVVGMMIESTSNSVYVFCAGTLLYQVGFTCIILLMEILVADFSSMRARVMFSYVPALPFIINTWISGNITSAVLRVATWRVGIGMWCIIYPLASLPLLFTLYSIDRRASSSIEPNAKVVHSTFDLLRRRGSDLLNQLDAVGLLILIMSFSLVLAPLTIAGGTVSRWRNPQIIVPLAIGLCLVPIFIHWERRSARSPLVPFHLLRDRGVWSTLLLRCLLNLAYYIQANYLYTVLVVAFDFSVESATRILSYFTFFGVISGVVTGWVVYKVRRLKLVVLLGICFWTAAFAVLIKFPGGASTASKAGMISGQILLGIAGGLSTYPTQAAIQAFASRDHVAILTGIYLSICNLGSALGTCLAGAIWSQTLYPLLESSLAFQPDASLARRVYQNPFEIVSDYPVGTEIRSAIIGSYRDVQRWLCISALCFCVPILVLVVAFKDPKLSDQQVQEDAEAVEGEED